MLALLLAIVVNTMAAACVSDTGGLGGTHCARKSFAARRVPHSSFAWVGSGCAESLQRAPEHCRMRGFTPAPTALPSAIERFAMRPIVAAKLAPPEARVIASSVGPPETDRGPPRS
jgi:hypothetical protein